MIDKQGPPTETLGIELAKWGPAEAERVAADILALDGGLWASQGIYRGGSEGDNVVETRVYLYAMNL